MYRNILVPVVFDHTPSEQKAMAVAHELIEAGGKVTLFHVVEQMPGYMVSQLPEDMLENTYKESVKRLEEIAKNAKHDVSVMIKRGHASRTILDYAEETGVDCIVISSHQPELADYLLGSTAARVVRHAKCSVHVLR